MTVKEFLERMAGKEFAERADNHETNISPFLIDKDIMQVTISDFITIADALDMHPAELIKELY